MRYPPTRRGGKRAIDQLWMTPETFGIVRKAGLVGQDTIFCTDHVGLFVDLAVGEYGFVKEMDSRVPHYLKSKSTQGSRRYVEYVRERVQRKKLGRAIDRLR